MKAHSVQVGYCVNCNGDLRVWVEHWHTTENPATTTMNIELNVNGNITFVNGIPDTSVQNVPIGSLPGCFTPMNVFAQCQGTGIYAPNTHNDWVAYDFPGVQCGVPIEITVISGNTVFTQDCGSPVNMFPASSGVFVIPCQTNQLPDDTLCAGEVATYNFPTGNTWTNSNPNIGLPASGTGNVGPFTAANVNNTQTGNIVVNNICGQETFSITVVPGPIADFDVQVGCPGQPVTFTNNSTTNGPGPTQYTWDFGDGSPNFNGANPPPHTYAGAGPYNVTLTIVKPNTGCSSDTTIVVDPLSGAVANFSAPSVCEGSITTLTDLSTPTGSILSWAWDFDNNGTVDDVNQNTTHNFGAAGTYNVELVVQVAGGCADSVVIPVVVNPLPVANFTGTNECFGTANSFTDLSNVATGTITGWMWDFGDPGTTADTSSLQNPTYLYPAPGTYTVTLTATSDSGCTDTYSTTVNVGLPPVADFTPDTVCAGNTSNFMDATQSSVGIQSWAWDFNNDAIVDATSQNPTYVYAGPGNYPVTLTVVDSNGCSHDTTKTIMVAGQPTADFTFTNECFGTANSFTDNSNGNGATITNWYWDFDNNGTVDNTNQNPTNGFPAAGVYTVELLVSSGQGCTDSITKQVTVNPIPTADFTVADVCFNTTSNFNDQSVITSGNIVQWQWNFGDGVGTSNTQNPTYTYTTPGTYPVTLTVTSDSGCINTLVDSAHVYYLPTAAFAVNNVCLNVAASFTDNSNGNGGTISNWEWDFDGNGTTDDMSQNPSHLYGTFGTYNVQLIVSTAAGCSDTIVQPIDVYPMPVADFNFTNQCYGTAVPFTDNSVVASGNIVNWAWDFDNGNTSAIQNPSENYGGEGVYNVELVVTTDNGCKDTISKNIEVYPIPVVNFTPTEVCLNTASQFQDLTVVSNAYTQNNIVSWSWNFGDGVGISNQQNPVYTYGQDGVFSANLTVVSNHGCTNDTTLDVTVNPLPVVSFTGPAQGCSPVCVQMVNNTVISTGAIAQWNWDFGDGSTSNAMDPSHCWFNESHASVANYDVTLTATSDKGCITTHTEPAMITSYPIPLADFTFTPQKTDIYDAEIYFTDQSIIASTWFWELGDGSTSTNQNPIHQYADSGTYVVTLYMENIYGCKDTATKNVIIDPTYAIWIPNVFTPDGDGINDFWFSEGYGITELHTYVFDRWGLPIFEGHQLDSKWNGIYKGKMGVQDTYVYRIEARDVFGEWHQYVGKVTLLK
ncbi:MAG: PKD domain-containing protein [Flavobacteriales bacterium]|nr:PKD domain-containing protein [Flavobacteriales bacterium]